MGVAVECDGMTHEKYNVDEQIKMFISIERRTSCLWDLLKIKAVEWHGHLSSFYND